MAQKTENEETEFKVVTEKTLSLCINNCGFTGSPATKNMCQKCFTFSGEKSVRSVSATSPRRSTFPADPIRSVEIPADRTATVALDVSTSTSTTNATVLKKEVNRCSGCRKRVGLTGFRCRCGDLFCSDHRYSDRHDCSYDYKSAGRETIARGNPVVKAAKIVRV